MQSLNLQPIADLEERTKINIYQHSSKQTLIRFHGMIIQRQRSTNASNDGKYCPWSPIFQRQIVDLNPDLGFSTLHSRWNKDFCPGKQSQEARR